MLFDTASPWSITTSALMSVIVKYTEVVAFVYSYTECEVLACCI